MKISAKEAAKLARKMGAFYEAGAWRFPSPAAAAEFRRLVGR